MPLLTGTEESFMETIGIALAFVGAAWQWAWPARGLPGGVGSVGEVGAGVLAQLLDGIQVHRTPICWWGSTRATTLGL